MSERQEQLSLAAEKELAQSDFWQKLERKYRIDIKQNKAAVWERRRLRRDRRVLTANAILGTKAVEVSFFGGKSSVAELVFDVDSQQLLTELNVTSELRHICLFAVADWELALITVTGEE